MSLGKLKICFFITALLGLTVIFGGSKALAISGAPSNVFPDTSLPGQGPTYAVVQLSNSPVKMKARTTIASIYVPISRANERIDFTVFDGCDNGPRDYKGWIADTAYYVARPNGTTLAFTNTATACSAGVSHIGMSFIADPSATITRHENYLVFAFVADAIGSEGAVGNSAGVPAGTDGRYLNSFQIWIGTAGINTGIANWPWPCDNIRYPNSCPRVRPIPGRATRSWVYSSFYGSSSSYGLQIPIKNTCSSTGGISFYDLDANDNSLGQNIEIRLTKGTPPNEVPQSRPGSPVDYLPHTAIENWANGIPGYLSSHPSPPGFNPPPEPLYGGNENQYLDIPGTDSSFESLSHFDAHTDYRLEIKGLSNDNAIQILVTLIDCPPDQPPSGGDWAECYEPLNAVHTTTIYPGDTFNARISMVNTGTTTWNNSNYQLFTAPGYTDNFENASGGRTGGYVTVNPTWPNVAIPPTWAVVFELTGTAPNAPGAYAYNWKMNNYGTGDFGQTCGVTVIVKERPVADPDPTGNVDIANCSQGIQGWAYDPSVPNQELTLHFYVGANFIGSANTNILRTDVNSSLGISGNHGFSFPIPDPYKDGSPHAITVYILGKDKNGNNNGANPAISTHTIICTDDAVCTVSLANVAGTRYPNSEYQATFTVTNTGTSNWEPGIWKLGSDSGITNNYLTNGNGNSQRKQITSTVGPGGTVTFTHRDKLLSGTNPFDWMMVHEHVRWFGQQCVMKITSVQGRIGDGFSWNANPRNGTINSCGWGDISTGTDSGGDIRFTFAVPQGQGFCVHLTKNNTPSNPDDIYVRPWAVGYRGCSPGYGHADGFTIRCTGSMFYGSVNGSGQVVPDQYAGVDKADGFDRSVDTGYDLALAWRPIVSCTITNSGAGTGMPYNPVVTVITGSPGGTTVPVAAGASITHTINAQTSTGQTSRALPRNDSEQVTLQPPVNFNAPSNYPTTASVTWTGGPYSGVQACPGAILRIVNQPYFKVYNGDTLVGANFNSNFTTCSPSTRGEVQAYANASTGGASTEYGLQAKKLIQGMYSSSSNATRPVARKALTFANTTSDQYGGKFERSGQCIKDYYEVTRKVTTQFNAAAADSVEGLNAGAQDSQIGRNGDLTLSGTASPFAGRLAIYVNGDLYINGNIQMKSDGFSGPSSYPFLAVIVKGDIYIKESVTNLDGMFVAQPTSANTKGNIYTCASGMRALHSVGNNATDGSSAMNANCANKLTFNGIVVAKRLKLLRTRGTLSAAAASEQTDPSGANIAEVFNGLPEMYIAESPFRADPVVNKQYDSAASLPPVL